MLKYLNRSLFTGPYIALCTSESDYLDELRRLKVKNGSLFIANKQSDATTHHLEHCKYGDMFIVCVRKNDKKPEQVAGLLIHEAVHVWQHIRDSIGASEQEHEFEAYAIQSIAQNLIYAYRPRLF